MPRPSLQKQDYIKLAEERGLNFVDNVVPYDTRVPCMWECIYCKTRKCIAYRSVKAASVGCTCQSAKSARNAAYTELAASLGIMWEPVDKLPRNTKDKTFWRGKNGQLVAASYHELGYGSIKKSLAEELGLSHETESGVFI